MVTEILVEMGLTEEKAKELVAGDILDLVCWILLESEGENEYRVE